MAGISHSKEHKIIKKTEHGITQYILISLNLGKHFAFNIPIVLDILDVNLKNRSVRIEYGILIGCKWCIEFWYRKDVDQQKDGHSRLWLAYSVRLPTILWKYSLNFCFDIGWNYSFGRLTILFWSHILFLGDWPQTQTGVAADQPFKAWWRCSCSVVPPCTSHYWLTLNGIIAQVDLSMSMPFMTFNYFQDIFLYVVFKCFNAAEGSSSSQLAHLQSKQRKQEFLLLSLQTIKLVTVKTVDGGTNPFKLFTNSETNISKICIQPGATSKGFKSVIFVLAAAELFEEIIQCMYK